MSGMTLICRNATPFTRSGAVDEEALRLLLQRFVDTRLGVYLASGGSGEGHALTNDEIRRADEIGVEVCKGKIQVNANQPERHTVEDTILHAQIAVDAGIDVVNIYGPAGWHGYKATDEEYRSYFDTIFGVINHPIARPNPIIGYTPSPKLIAEIADKYDQVVAVNLSGITGDTYFVNLKKVLDSDVETYVAYPGSLNMFALGATGLLGAEANLIPKTFRKYIDAYEAGNATELGRVYSEIKRTTQYLDQWKGTSPRWIKMAFKVFKLPGGEGGPRAPYLMPDEAELQRFTEGALALGVEEIDELAEAAGLLSR